MPAPRRTPDELRTEAGRKRVRILFGGTVVADSTQVLLVWEWPFYPTYHFPGADVRTDLLVPTGEEHHGPGQPGRARVHTLEVGDREAPGAVRWYDTAEIAALEDHLRFDWEAMDAWFEEDEQVHVHARDPYTRIDVLHSSRQVEVEVDDLTVADSHHPRLLFETGLPVRYYLPKTDVRMDLLRPSDHHSECPYKGTASYYDLEIDGATHENLVWWYPVTTPEATGIAGCVCFYNEKVDLTVDGERQERPRTHFT